MEGRIGGSGDVHDVQNSKIYYGLLVLDSRVRERRGAFRALMGKSEGRNDLEDPGIDGRIILKWIFEKWDWEAQT